MTEDQNSKLPTHVINNQPINNHPTNSQPSQLPTPTAKFGRKFGANTRLPRTMGCGSSRATVRPSSPISSPEPQTASTPSERAYERAKARWSSVLSDLAPHPRNYPSAPISSLRGALFRLHWLGTHARRIRVVASASGAALAESDEGGGSASVSVSGIRTPNSATAPLLAPDKGVDPIEVRLGEDEWVAKVARDLCDTLREFAGDRAVARIGGLALSVLSSVSVLFRSVAEEAGGSGCLLLAAYQMRADFVARSKATRDAYCADVESLLMTIGEIDRFSPTSSRILEENRHQGLMLPALSMQIHGSLPLVGLFRMVSFFTLLEPRVFLRSAPTLVDRIISLFADPMSISTPLTGLLVQFLLLLLNYPKGNDTLASKRKEIASSCRTVFDHYVYDKHSKDSSEICILLLRFLDQAGLPAPNPPSPSS